MHCKHISVCIVRLPAQICTGASQHHIWLETIYQLIYNSKSASLGRQMLHAAWLLPTQASRGLAGMP
jgi:hypothetical protein